MSGVCSQGTCVGEGTTLSPTCRWIIVAENPTPMQTVKVQNGRGSVMNASICADFGKASGAIAGSYVVTVFDEAAHVVQRGDAVQKTTWTPSRALPRETTLVWQVEAHRGQDTVTAPLSPARPAKFRVLDAASAERLAGVEASYPRSHVMLGILFAEAGVVDAAETHFEQVSAGDPHGAVARETLARLHSPSR